MFLLGIHQLPSPDVLSLNFVITEAKASNYKKLARIYDWLAEDYMKARREDKTPCTMEDKVIALMSTFPINSKWLADHP